MSIRQVCDICGKSTGKWEFRKRWNISRFFVGIAGGYWKEMDMCDACVEDFKKFIRLKDQGKL